MDALSTWDTVILIVASTIAVLSLVKLMAAHRDRLLADVRRQLEEEHHRRATEKRLTPPTNNK
jgi:hypothetical protein